MNVLYILPVGERGGAERIVESWVGAHSSHVRPFVVMPPGPLLDSFQSMGVWAVAPPNFRMSRLIDSVIFLGKIIKENKIDLIHSSMPKGHLFGGIASLFFGVKELWFNHGPISGEYWQGFIPLIPSKRLLVNSEYMYRMQLNTLYASRELKIQRLGINTALIRPSAERRNAFRERYNLSPETLVIGVFGRLVRLKGQDVMLKAMAKLKTMLPNGSLVCFLVGGTLFGLEEDYSIEVRSLIKSLHLENEVVMVNHTDDVYDYYDLIDVLVNPSVSPETFGLVVAEAMAKEKVVVASDAGGPRELIEHSSSGFLVKPGNEDELANTLFSIANMDVQRRAEMGRKARSFIVKNYDLSVSVKALEKSYEEVVGL